MATNAQVLSETGGLDAVLEARGFAYGLLAQAFLYEPTPSRIQSWIEGDLMSLFPYADQPGPIQEGAAEVSAYLANPASATTEAQEHLLWDYTRLFLGPARLPAPPYESAYLSADRLLFQAETLAVRQVYRSYGLISAKAGSEPDDHIGLELQFLAETCRLAAERANQGNLAGMEQVLRDQASFLDEHLLPWASKFAADVIAHAQVDFYRGVARLLTGFLSVDRQLLNELLADRVGPAPSAQ